MSIRIRYEKFDDPDGKYDVVSVRNFHSPRQDNMYIVYLDTKNCDYAIRNMSDRGRIYTGGENINNLHVLKRKVKDRLESLGVKFDEKEVRDNSSRVKGLNCSYNTED